MPGFGHPVHKPLDPRAERILELADERGVSGPHVGARAAFRDAVAEVWGKPLTMNVSMPIAAVLLDLGFPVAAAKAVPILARTAGLLAHLAEEQQQPLGFLLAREAEEAIEYEPRRVMLEPEVESRPWAEQLALDDASYRTQLAYLFERSAFYREKLTAAGIDSAAAAGGLADIARLPLTDKRELRATVAPAIRSARTSASRRPRSSASTRRAARRARPPTSRSRRSDLENWLTGSARSYAASGIAAGQRVVTTYDAGPFVAGAALAAFDRIGLSHIPFGTGNTERLMQRSSASAPRPPC